MECLHFEIREIWSLYFKPIINCSLIVISVIVAILESQFHFRISLGNRSQVQETMQDTDCHTFSDLISY